MIQLAPNEKGRSLRNSSLDEILLHPKVMRVVGYVSLLFFIASLKSCAELHYYLAGQDKIGRVVRVRKSTAPQEETPLYRVTYEFRNPETHMLQQGYAMVSAQRVRNFEPQQKVLVEFRGDAIVESRLKGESNLLWVYGFAGSSLFFILGVAVLSYQSVLEERRLRQRKWWIR